MRVEVAVRGIAVVGVGVGVEDPAPPPREQTDGEYYYDDPYRYFGGLLDPLRQVLSQQYERHPHQDERRPMSQAPAEAHGGGLPELLLFLGDYECGNGGQMVRVAGMPQTQ